MLQSSPAAVSVGDGMSDPTDGGRIYNAQGASGMGDHPARSVCASETVERVTRADLDKQPHEVAEMFDGVADRYDLTNTVLAFGQDRGWRRATRAALGLRPGERVLDVGAGTGVSTEELSRSGALAVGADLSIGMLRAGRRVRADVPLLAADALRLPFADETFDAVTISFAL